MQPKRSHAGTDILIAPSRGAGHRHIDALRRAELRRRRRSWSRSALKLFRFGGRPSAWGDWSPQGGVHRAENPPTYPPDFRRRIVELVRSGRTPDDLVKEYEPSAQTIRTWARQDRVDAGEHPGLTSDEREELAQLIREVRQLREEKEILRKATVVFVRETSR